MIKKIVFLIMALAACSLTNGCTNNEVPAIKSDEGESADNQHFEVAIFDSFPVFMFAIAQTDKQEMLELGLRYTYTLSISCPEKPEMISQTFDFTSGIDGITANSLTSEISFVDIDFDGYLDIEIEVGRGNVNRLFQYYRWDNSIGKYEEAPFFEMSFAGYRVFPDAKQIVATSRSSAASYGRAMYQLIDGNYVLLRVEDVEIIKGDGDDDVWVVHIMEGQDEIYSETHTFDEYLDISAERNHVLRYGLGEAGR